jgi:hypothetical protein
MPILTRRRFLAAAGVGAALVAGAGGGALLGQRRDVQPAPFVPPAAPSQLTAAVSREQSLVAAHTAAITAHPELQARLAPILADHTAHLDVVARELARLTQATTVPTTIPTAAAPAETTAQAIAALSAAESAAAAAAGASCLAVLTTPAGTAAGSLTVDLAVVLGTICAAETVHVAMLA